MNEYDFIISKYIDRLVVKIKIIKYTEIFFYYLSF